VRECMCVRPSPTPTPTPARPLYAPRSPLALCAAPPPSRAVRRTCVHEFAWTETGVHAGGAVVGRELKHGLRTCTHLQGAGQGVGKDQHAQLFGQRHARATIHLVHREGLLGQQVFCRQLQGDGGEWGGGPGRAGVKRTEGERGSEKKVGAKRTGRSRSHTHARAHTHTRTHTRTHTHATARNRTHASNSTNE
jgi:hypothetical protein